MPKWNGSAWACAADNDAQKFFSLNIFGALLAGDVRSMMVIAELVLMLVPAFMLMSPASRRDLGQLVRAAMAETRISGAEPTIVSDPWCSLTQKRE